MAREPQLVKYLDAIRSTEKLFQGFIVTHIPHADNEEADTLAKAAAQGLPVPPKVFSEVLTFPALHGDTAPRTVHALTATDWRAPIIAFLRDDYTPENRTEEQRLLQRCWNYRLINRVLFKGGISAPLLRCISTAEGHELLDEIRQGDCSTHAALWSITGKAFRQGFDWPTALPDAEEIVRRCQAYQWNGRKWHTPSSPLQPIPPVWPLARWGIDIMGELPTAPGSFRYTMVAVEYFTKWVKAKPITAITSSNIQRFLWKNIICRFGVPRELTVDNGKQFNVAAFRTYCSDVCIKLCFASVYHPQSNDACERANGTIFSALSKKIFSTPKGKWAAELPEVLWGLRINEARPTGYSAFWLMFGDEAVTPEELLHGSYRT